MRTYTTYQTDIPRYINNSDSDNLLWATEMINDSLRYLTTRYYFNERSYTTTTTAQTQFYNLPPQVKKLINVTVNIGSVLWQPEECPNRQMWDALNVITFYQDFPSKFFVYNGKMGLFPIPASSSNTITMNYKTRIDDLTQTDVTGTATITTNTTTVTATAGTPFLNWMAGQWIRIGYSSTNSTNGDNQWYQIDTVTSSTVLVLKNPYTGATVTAGAFTIGQAPLLPEDYQDLPLYQMAYLYYTTRLPDPTRAELYKKLYDDRFQALDNEFGSKTTSIVLTDTDGPQMNPNLFVRTVSQN